MATGYTYRALNPDRQEIRLLRILHQDRTHLQPLRCYMEHVSLNNLGKLHYNAVSYYWGDIKKRKDVIIDDVIVSVPENVELALRYLHNSLHWTSHNEFLPAFKKSPWKHWHRLLGRDRLDKGHSHLWIDAICINQHDIDERNQQVALMELVYSKALMTVVWLGEDTDGLSKPAVNSITKLYEQYRRETNNEKNVQAVLADDRRGPSDASLSGAGIMMPRFAPGPLPDRLDWDALEAYFGSTWFSRTWVMQEVLLAQTSICVRGDWVCPCYVAVAAANWLNSRRLFISTTAVEPFLRPRIMFWQFRNLGWGHQPQRGNVYQLLTDLTHFDTTEPVDKIYSVLSLLPGLKAQITPDYRVPFRSVYVQASRAIIADSQNLHLLNSVPRSIAPPEAPATDDFPSWVLKLHWKPDLDAEEVSAMYYNGGHAPGFRDLLDISDLGSGDVLKLRGLIVDEVAHEPFPQRLFPEQLESRFSDELLEILKYAKDKLSMLDADAIYCRLWECLSMGEVPGIAEDGSHARRVPTLKGVEQFHLLTDIQALMLWAHETRLSVEIAMNQSKNRPFYITKGNRMGVGFPGMRKGDKICFLFGGPTPYILRQSGDYWKLIGDTYLQGLMEGEYFHEQMQDADALVLDDTCFQLC